MTGFADIHTHWMAHLGFGGHLIWGLPAGDMAEALTPCDGRNHDARFRILGRDVARRVLDSITRLEAAPNAPRHLRHGFPDFGGWPTYATMCHQQMHIDWVRRAYEGGLRLMSTLAVNNRLLSWCMEARREQWDDEAIREQVLAVRTLVNSPENREWMEVALSATAAQRILEAGKLAIVLGVEVDQVELLISRDPDVLAELDGEATDYLTGRSNRARRIASLARALYDLGVRQITPIHLADNVFGGAALYMDAVASNSHWLQLWRQGRCSGDDIGWPEVVTGSGGIEFKLQSRQVPFNRETAFYRAPVNNAVLLPSYAQPTLNSHANARGLTSAGVVFLVELWRHGILVDLDHMSAFSTKAALELAEQCGMPMIASHCSPRELTATRHKLNVPENWWSQWDGRSPNRQDAPSWPILRHEGMRTSEELRRLYELGGIVGILARQPTVMVGGSLLPAGAMSGTAAAFRHVAQVLGRPTAIALGTDMNGMNQAPYDADSRRVNAYESGGAANLGRRTDGTKTWDISADGLAHYGLLPDMLQLWRTEESPFGEMDSLMSSAAGYVHTWRRAEKAARGLPKSLNLA